MVTKTDWPTAAAYLPKTKDLASEVAACKPWRLAELSLLSPVAAALS